MTYAPNSIVCGPVSGVTSLSALPVIQGSSRVVDNTRRLLDYGVSLLPMLKLIEPVKKVWGKEYWVVNTDKYCFKILQINAGFQCSSHYHTVKDETFVVFDGSVQIDSWNDHSMHSLQAKAGSYVHIPPGTRHRFSSKFGAIVFEVSTHHDDADVTRLEESRKMTE